MPDRWMLNRAGITNVYQYADETLDFGGGRLLLRGVNGSGKSTAMNMLLPFLLDANTRRIDAAGEQSSVLRSWMLSGRDEPQPVGYLWIEFAWGDEHLVCGCGIRANRSTDRVTTWWFVTSRRPGVDLSLVEGRVPLSVDALRAELGSHCVFPHEQRAAYRSEVQAKLFGGADLDQHVRLLHVVRNPRVGDRIDVDLPSYLEDALPQLSETAIDDAAQPLEDLEEHRRNVEDMGRTAAALDALQSVFEAYARAELRRRAGLLLEQFREVRDQRRNERRVRDQADIAAAGLAQVTAEVAGHEADERRLRDEIDALKDAPAYQAGQSLDDLRGHVKTLAANLETARRRADRAGVARSAAAQSVIAAHRTFHDDSSALARQLSDLALQVTSAGLQARPSDAPSTGLVVLDDLNDPESAPVVAPAHELDTERVSAALGEIRADTANRGGDIAEVRDARAKVVVLEAKLRQTEADLERANGEAGAAEAKFVAARERLVEVTDSWRGDLRLWIDRFNDMAFPPGDAAADANNTTNPVAAASAAEDAIPGLFVEPLHIDGLDLGHAPNEITRQLLTAATTLVDHHQRLGAELHSRRRREHAEVEELQSQQRELAERTYPEPPTAPWQRSSPRPRLVDLIDFHPDLAEAERIGLEAAMQASGLLGAEFEPDGSLQLETGELMVAPATQVAAPLSDVLTITIPDELAIEIDETTLAKVLDSISTSQTGEATSMVSTDGSFRLGALRGRHTKTVAEHIGVTARRAALQRQRDDVAARLVTAQLVLDSTDQAIEASRQRTDRAVLVRNEIPPASPVIEARLRAEQAEERLSDARDLVDERTASLAGADRAHADADTDCRRQAATLGLPSDRAGLDQVELTLREITAACDRIAGAITALIRSCAHWRDVASRWNGTVAEQGDAIEQLQRISSEHEPMAMRLATLEDTIGIEYAEVLAALEVSQRDLEVTTAQLSIARQAHLDAKGEAGRLTNEVDRAEADRDAAESRCVAAMPALRDALAVPGLVAAAVGSITEDAIDAGDTDSVIDSAVADSDPSEFTFAPVPETPEGARQLADDVLARVPEAERENVTSESVRQSLRQRRDSLGSGWDAEDHQRSEALPLFVEVTGPLGRMPLASARREVGVQLRHQSSLLSAKQDQALRNLLQGLIAREVAEKLHAANQLVALMNRRLDTVTTSHGIGAGLRWRRIADIEPELAVTIDLLAKPPDLRTVDENHELAAALSTRIEEARRLNPEMPYRQLIAEVLDYRRWHQMSVLIRRPGHPETLLTRRTPLSEGEKKMVSYLPLFAAVAASCDALGSTSPQAPRFVLLDDAFAKVSEDNHAGLFGLLVEMDLDFIATSERLWGTHGTVPELAITEVIRDAQLGVIVLEHSRWDGLQKVTTS